MRVSEGKQELNFSLAPDTSVTFRYRILISSPIATPEATEAAYKDFAPRHIIDNRLNRIL
jgi:hypothetical protein